METYQTLVETVIIDNKNHLINYDKSLKLIGKGRSAYVFKLKTSSIAIKIFFSEFSFIAREEMEIYNKLKKVPYYPIIYDSGANYIAMEYIHGDTLFDYLVRGQIVTPSHIKEIDYALSLTKELGLNPSDIHLRNIIITDNNEIKLIDVARFRQAKECKQWDNLKKAYYQLYCRSYFLKKIPAAFLNIAAFLYKKGLIPCYRM